MAVPLFEETTGSASGPMVASLAGLRTDPGERAHVEPMGERGAVVADTVAGVEPAPAVGDGFGKRDAEGGA